MATVTMKQGDLARKLVDTLKLDGAAIDLTGASVKCVIRNIESGNTVVDANAAIVAPATNGKVEYVFSAGQTDIPGRYRQEWRVTFTGAKPATVPDATYNEIIILDNLS